MQVDHSARVHTLESDTLVHSNRIRGREMSDTHLKATECIFHVSAQPEDRMAPCLHLSSGEPCLFLISQKLA